jgi:hypothetical protein
MTRMRAEVVGAAIALLTVLACAGVTIALAIALRALNA